MINVKSDNGLLVSIKSERFLMRIYPPLMNFPKSEKFALCSEIKYHCYKLISNIEMANSVPSKRTTYAQEADGHLQIIKILMKVSKEQHYISKGMFREFDEDLTEINKLLSGFIRSSRR